MDPYFTLMDHFLYWFLTLTKNEENPLTKNAPSNSVLRVSV